MEKDLELSLKKAKPADEGISSFTETIGYVPTPLEKGDVITFPDTIKGNSFRTKIGARMYEYIVVHVKSADGNERQANFSPSLFRKRARVCDWDTVDGVDIAIPTKDFVDAGGSIVEKIYKKNAKVNDVVTAVLGKSIRIEEVHEVESLKFGTKNEQDLIKVYDFEPEGWTIRGEGYDDSYETPKEWSIGQHNGHEWVDLGLLSGVKWATSNVGASSPQDYGDYFVWGETEPKVSFDDGNNYQIYGLSISDLESQGYIDREGNLTPLHDAATANWGGNWRMPTKEEIEELERECIGKLTTQNGVTGYKVIGPNGYSIFLPVIDFFDRLGGSLWSSTPTGGDRRSYCAAYILTYSFKDDRCYHQWGSGFCYCGSFVRPVLE